VPWFIIPGQGGDATPDPEDPPGRMLADNWVAPAHPMSAVGGKKMKYETEADRAKRNNLHVVVQERYNYDRLRHRGAVRP
jgi:hypothetical protein